MIRLFEHFSPFVHVQNNWILKSVILLLLAIGGSVFPAEEDYRAYLEKAFEVMATRTMEYQHAVGMGKGRKKVVFYQILQEGRADGSVVRRERRLGPLEKTPREKFPLGAFTFESYFTDEGFTKVYISREKRRGIRMKQSIPHRRIPAEARVSGQVEQQGDEACWKIQVKWPKDESGVERRSEYLVSQRESVLYRERDFDGNGRLQMEVKNENFNFHPQSSQKEFRLPPLDEIHFAKNVQEFSEMCQNVTWEIVQEAIPESRGGTRKSPLARKEGFFLRSWRRLRRSSVRAATCGVLLLAVLSLGTALALKSRSKRGVSVDQ